MSRCVSAVCVWVSAFACIFECAFSLSVGVYECVFVCECMYLPVCGESGSGPSETVGTDRDPDETTN